FKAKIMSYYEEHGSWAGLNDEIGPAGPSSSGPPDRPTPAPDPRAQTPFALVDADRVVVVTGKRYDFGSVVPEAELAGGEPVIINGSLVGTVLKPALGEKHDAAGTEYLAQT